MKFRDKKILIFGLARSGLGAANLLAFLGAKVTVTDKKAKEELSEFAWRLSPSISLVCGGHPEDVVKGMDMIIVSPGVPMNILPLKRAKEAGIKIIGELELAYQVIQDTEYRIQDKKNHASSIVHHPSSLPSFLAVTGTNGKSTATTLLDLMLKKGGFRTLLGGNIGNALTEEIGEMIQDTGYRMQDKKNHASCIMHQASVDYIVAEVSNFQLESIDTFRPEGATVLNITPDHMDRYSSMDEYRNAKARIFLNQKEDDFIVLNADDPETMKVESEKLKVKSKKPKIFYFSRKKEVSGVYYKNGFVYSNFNSPLLTLNSKLIHADEIKIKGVHNLENAMAASAMALLAKCPAEAVANVLREFPGLEHRLEFVRELDGVIYINDSKGTNVGAVMKSIESFKEPVILIAGGRDKAGDFSLLRPFIKNRVKKLVLIGEASEKIRNALGDVTRTIEAGSLEEAVNLSRKSASKGDVVLLSPACASFDMFRDFEDRGKQFKNIVKGLA